MLEKFSINFTASLIAYFIVPIGGFILGLGIPVLSIGMTAVLFFFLGRILNLLGEPWLNYLSVGGGFIAAMVIVIAFLGFFVGVFATILPFMMLWSAADYYVRGIGDGSLSIVFACIIATFPVILTWLGMLYQSRKAVNHPPSACQGFANK